MDYKINIKPLSINKAFQGRRFKTQDYKSYELELISKLPEMEIPKDILIDITITVGFSNRGSDLDNIAKPFIDILQKKYLFNDSKIYKLTMNKKIVKKGDDYITFNIQQLNIT